MVVVVMEKLCIAGIKIQWKNYWKKKQDQAEVQEINLRKGKGQLWNYRRTCRIWLFPGGGPMITTQLLDFGSSLEQKSRKELKVWWKWQKLDISKW